MSKRKQRVDSATAAVSIMQGAVASELDPPEHCPLPEAAMPFWRAIIRGRTREEWLAAPTLLATASQLAWTQWQIVKLRADVELEAVPDAKAVKRLDDLNRLEMSALRVLQQHGRATGGETRDVAKRRDIARGIEADNPLADDLLARPSIQ